MRLLCESAYTRDANHDFQFEVCKRAYSVATLRYLLLRLGNLRSTEDQHQQTRPA